MTFISAVALSAAVSVQIYVWSVMYFLSSQLKVISVTGCVVGRFSKENVQTQWHEEETEDI